MNDFNYFCPVRVHFGQGAAQQNLVNELKKQGKTVLLAYGSGSIHRNGIYNEMKQLLEQAEKRVVEFSGIMSNPTYAKVQQGAALARQEKVDFILAVGGGSVLDCCKIIAAQAVNEEDIWEMEFTDHRYPVKMLPMGAVVTASGTGAEMNNGAVITHEAKKIKAGMLGASAEFAILDPAYTLSVPLKQVISGAFDTLSHCMETYFGTPRDNNLSDQINEAIMRSVIDHMRAVMNAPQDIQPRTELMWASSLAENGLLKIGKVTDFQAHQIEHQLAAYTNCNHGQGLAVIHPALYRHLAQGAPEKFARFARLVWHVDSQGKTVLEQAMAGIEALQSFIEEMGLPTTFKEMGITDYSCFEQVAATCNRPAGCCRKLSNEEIVDILNECTEGKAQ